MTTQSEFCPHCNLEAHVVHERREVPLGQRRVVIEDERLRCDSCGEEFYTPEQADQRHARAVAQARAEDNLLTPSELKEIRLSLRLTQRQMEQLLGIGEKTWVRYETGRVCQNVTTDRLIRLLLADSKNVRVLAAINGVALQPATAELLACSAALLTHYRDCDYWPSVTTPQTEATPPAYERHRVDAYLSGSYEAAGVTVKQSPSMDVQLVEPQPVAVRMRSVNTLDVFSGELAVQRYYSGQPS